MGESEQVLAIDIGGSKLMTGIITAEGEIIRKEIFHYPEKFSKQQLINKIVEQCLHIKTDQVTCCGVAIPGLTDIYNGIWRYSPFSGIRNVPIVDLLQAKLGIPVFIDNDVNVCAIGEKEFGSCKKEKNYLWVTISNGIGGGLVLNGEIYRGESFEAGEIGHFIVEETKPRLCGCGKKGCLEAMASGASISSIYEEITGRRQTAKEIAEFASAGDRQALAVYISAGYYIGKAISYCVNLLNLPKVVLGGGVSRAFDLFYPVLIDTFNKNVFKTTQSKTLIEQSSLGYDAALIGCVAITKKGMENKR